jgi:hypothetical protein
VCRRLTLADSWVIFPPDAKAEEGRWVHRHCATDTQLRMLFGTKNITFMRGEDAIRRLLTSLDDRADPALARKRLRAVVKAKA